jgi:ABC-2 type transport system ATP-binding protein
MTDKMDSPQERKPTHQEVAIHTEGLTRRYGEVDALVDLDLSVPYGSIFGFLGRNGAGKTTTIRLLTGLAHPTRGRAWVAGYETTNSSHRARRLFGYLPQEPAFYSWMTGREFLTYISRLSSLRSDEGKVQVERVLELTDLQKAAKRRIGGYSGGMKQRLAIAQALIGKPPVLLLDEPTSSLDPAGRHELLNMIASLKGEVTVFFSSHILSDIERVCDTIAVIHEGHLILVSEKEQLLEKYAVNAALLELDSKSLPISKVFLDDLEKRDWVSRVTVAENTIRILASDVPQAKNELLPIIVKHRIAINHYEWIRPSLEEIFLQISR